MGEYARRKKDNIEVKIGTCNSMYYMTPSQVFDVEDSSTNLYKYFNELSFRIWMPHEESVQVGDFEEYQVDMSRTRFELEPSESDVQLYREHPGIVRQEVLSTRFRTVHSDQGATGLVVKFKCYHGFNKSSDDDKDKENGLMLINNAIKTRVFCLEAISFKDKIPVFIARCGICGHPFCYSYDEFKNMNFYDYNTFKDHDEYIDLKNYINKKLYDLQCGANSDFYKQHIDFTEILPFIPERSEKE